MDNLTIPKEVLDNPRTQSLITIANKIVSHDLEALLLDHNEILNTAITLHESLTELKLQFEEWKKSSDTLMTKFFFHSISLEKSLAGIDVSFSAFKDSKSRKILDIPTSNVIHRAQLETFLIYHFIYVNPESEDEKKFRFNVWLYSGLLNRQKLPATLEFAIKQKDADKVVIENLKKEIEASECFKNLSTKKREGIIKKGEERLYLAWVDIMAEIGFSEKHMFSKPIYHVLSSYAHSSVLSILQIKGSNYGYNSYNSDAATTTYSSSVLLSFMISSIKKLYPVIEIQYNTLPSSVRDKIELYSLMASTPMFK